MGRTWLERRGITSGCRRTQGLTVLPRTTSTAYIAASKGLCCPAPLSRKLLHGPSCCLR